MLNLLLRTAPCQCIQQCDESSVLKNLCPVAERRLQDPLRGWVEWITEIRVLLAGPLLKRIGRIAKILIFKVRRTSLFSFPDEKGKIEIIALNLIISFCCKTMYLKQFSVLWRSLLFVWGLCVWESRDVEQKFPVLMSCGGLAAAVITSLSAGYSVIFMLFQWQDFARLSEDYLQRLLILIVFSWVSVDSSVPPVCWVFCS